MLTWAREASVNKTSLIVVSLKSLKSLKTFEPGRGLRVTK